MSDAQRFSYTKIDPGYPSASELPFLPVVLKLDDQVVDVHALVDSGSAINVLPYNIGLHLGAVWENQNVPVKLTGNLAELDARAVLMDATVGQFEPVRLAFAWTQSNHVPTILGQINFFMEFDVCFFRSKSAFEVKRKA